MVDENNQSASPDEIWISISDLAREKNVDKAEISRRVARLEAEKGLRTRSGRNRSKLVCLQEYDLLAGETTDLSKEQAAQTARVNREDWSDANYSAGGDSRFRDAQTRKAQYEAGLKQLELARQMGAMVDVRRVNDVIAEVGEELRKPIDQLLLRSDELHAAALAGGVPAVRARLKDIVFDMRQALTDALDGLADLRPEGGSAPA